MTAQFSHYAEPQEIPVGDGSLMIAVGLGEATLGDERTYLGIADATTSSYSAVVFLTREHLGELITSLQGCAEAMDFEVES